MRALGLLFALLFALFYATLLPMLQALLLARLLALLLLATLLATLLLATPSRRSSSRRVCPIVLPHPVLVAARSSQPEFS